MKFWVYISILFIFSFISNISNAEEQEIVAIGEETPPYVISEKNEVKGVIVDKIREIMKAANLRVKISLYPWKRAYDFALDTPNTLLFPMGKTPEREQLFYFIEVLYISQTFFYKLSSTKDHINSIEEAKKYTICTIKEDLKTQYLKQKKFPYLEEVGLIEGMVRNLFNHKCEFAIGGTSFTEVAKKFSTDTVKAERAFEVKDIKGERFLAISKKSDPALVKRLEEASKSLK